jgi:predicted transposase/invertase (TIGR01784 family)
VKLLELSEDEENRMIYEAEVKQQRDDRARMRGALEQGIAQGRAEGRTEGRIEGKIETAKKLLKRKLSIDEIAEDTGLPREEIAKLCIG